MDGDSVILSKIILNPFVYIIDSYMAEKFSGGIDFSSQYFFHDFFCHANTIVSNRNLQKRFAVRSSCFIGFNYNSSGAALWFNAMEESIFYNRLEGKR